MPATSSTQVPRTGAASWTPRRDNRWRGRCPRVLELLTDANGEFAVPERTHFTPIGKILAPEFVVYSPGYASFPGLGAWPQDSREVDAAYAKREFNFKLTRLKTREERLRRQYPFGLLKVPDAKMPNLIRLVNDEGHALGLPPIRSLGR